MLVIKNIKIFKKNKVMSITSPLVTIAIPIYNAEKYIRNAIQSCINQTYQNWELLLMCDGSTDKSTAIAKEMANGDSRIKLIDDGQNRGLIARLNQSVEMCETKYYARMDADDIMCINRIEEQVKFMEAHTEVDVCGSSIMTIDNKNKIIGSSYNEGKTDSFFHPTVMGRAQWFKANRYADWALRAEDFELWIRTSSNSNFYAIAKPLLFYREFGVPTFKKYYLTQKTIIKVATHYKEYGKSFSWFVKTTIFSYVKIFIDVVLSLIGKMDLLVAMRRRKQLPNGVLLTDDDLIKVISSVNY